jgi:hypothetical protein
MIAIILAAALSGIVLLWLFSRKDNSPSTPIIRQSVIDRKVGPPRLYPDPLLTPGAVNPSITQANIGENICNPDWSTRSIRPPESYTAKLKRQQMFERGLTGSPSDYEEDHLISLELGGSPSDPRNLWPQAYGPKPAAREKDAVENYLHKQVCGGMMTLLEAQTAIVTDWYRVYLEVERH